MQLPLLASRSSPAAPQAGSSLAGAPGSASDAGSRGSSFGAVLGEFLADKPAGAAGGSTATVASAEALPASAAADAEGVAENAGTLDGAAAAQADVTVAVPDAAAAFGQMLLTAPAVVPVAVPDAAAAFGQMLLTAPAVVPVAVPDAAAAFGQMLLTAPAVVPVAVPVPADTAAVGSPTAALSGSDLPAAEPVGTQSTRDGAGSDAPTPAGARGANTPAVGLNVPGNPGGATTPAVSTPTASGSSATPTAGPAVGAEAGPAPTAGQSPTPTAAAFAAVLPAPVHGLPVLQRDAPASTTAPAAAAPFTEAGRLTPQLAGPLFSLASAAPGHHVMTLQVSPEDLGPMTVRAHIDATGVRIELFAPGDAGRDALRTILPELRRGLAESGLGASLDLSDHGAPPDGGAGEPGQDRRALHGSQPPLTSAATAERPHPGRPRTAVVLPGTTPAVLDILV